MKIMMTKTMRAASRPDGAESQTFPAGHEFEAVAAWQMAIFQGFVKAGAAYEIGGNAAPAETKTRARNADGTLKADDPATPDVNEAWEKPKPKRRTPARKA